MVDFLVALHKQVRRKIIMVWDRSSVHRASRKRLQRSHPYWFDFEWLPSYAPELDPVEQCWNHAKCCDLANFVPSNLDQLEEAVVDSMGQQRDNPKLLRSYFGYAGLKL